MPLITLTAELLGKPMQVQRDYLHQLASSLNDALEKMQKERDEWGRQATNGKQQVVALQSARQTDNTIIVRMTEQIATLKRQHAEQIAELRSKHGIVD